MGKCRRPSDVSLSQTDSWIEVSIDLHPSAHEAAAHFLFDLGCRGLSTQDSLIKAYFSGQDDIDHIREKLDIFLHELRDIFRQGEPPVLRVSRIEDQDWSMGWRAYFHSERITPGLVVVPAWEPAPPKPGPHLIRFDPGPAFGTGQHPTTRMCLAAMENLPIAAPWTMLDIGTGSGILAIYAAKLGARRVLALDTDPEALRWAEKCIALNDVPVWIELSSMTVEEVIESFDLVTANLTLDVIEQLMPHFHRLLEPRGWVILSGLLREQVERVAEKLNGCGFQRIQAFHQEEWASVVGKREKAVMA